MRVYAYPRLAPVYIIIPCAFVRTHVSSVNIIKAITEGVLRNGYCLPARFALPTVPASVVLFRSGTF